jgi:4-hydroxythreonine-4-phosphate dehydrogenase
VSPATSTPPAQIGLCLGDPSGIGPEICLAARNDERVRAALRLVLIGPGSLRPADVPLADEVDPAAAGPLWIDSGGPRAIELGRPQAECGRAALSALRTGADLASAGRIAALVTAPVSKHALHLAGERVEGQSELLGRWAGAGRMQMVALSGFLRVMLLTRHLPLRQALDAISFERVLDHLLLFAESLRAWGFGDPHLALAGLNPHAGEAGLLGGEEQELLEPAVRSARAAGLTVSGPISPDTVFKRAAAGEFDGVLALFHDQGFIPIKLGPREQAFTVLAGLPYLRVSPAHGTAFEIAGRGLASPENLIGALLLAADWVRRGPVLRDRAGPARPAAVTLVPPHQSHGRSGESASPRVSPRTAG